MDFEAAKALCRSFPGCTEDVKWGADLVFSVGLKMFAVTGNDAPAHVISFKVDDDRFLELTDRPGIIPAPYMAKHKYGNTVTDDLWSAVSASAGRPVKPFMDSFTLQGGVPLIRAGEPSCVRGSSRIALSQGRFGLDAPSKVAQRWLVPVDLSAGGAPAMKIVSGPAPQRATVPGCGTARRRPTPPACGSPPGPSGTR